MIEPELQNYLSGINQNLTEIKNKKTPGIWRSFFNGMFTAFGYFVGFVLIIAIVGWILNKTGYLAEFRQQAKDFQTFMDQARKAFNVGEGSGVSPNSTQTYILPDGTKVEVSK